MTCNNLMIDLETLGTNTDAAIVQIAAVWFDPETGATGATFNALIRNSSGSADIDTIAWWLQQAHAPVLGAKLADPSQSGDEAELLAEFCRFVSVHLDLERVWAHGGTSFDFPILQSALERHGLSVPWSYRAPRDTRSLYDLAPGGMPRPPKDETRAHDALYDCEYQIAQVCEALKALREQADQGRRWRAEYLVTEEARASFEEGYNELRRYVAAQDPVCVPRTHVLDIPVWSAAEGRCESHANPDASPDSVCE